MNVALLLSTLFVAYANGANDNIKGVATLIGSRTLSYRQGLTLATGMTAIGSLLSVGLAAELIKAFSGKGLVPDAIANGSAFHGAVAIGTGLTVIAATFLGFPISTTHGLTGALVGAGLVAVGRDVNFSALQKTFLLPLILGPMLAIPLGMMVYWLVGRLAKLSSSSRGLTIGHCLSAGLVSLARGLNDTPKIVPLMLIGSTISVQAGSIAVAVAIALGGVFNARRVATTMSERIATMDEPQGLGANLATGLLVIAATRFGLPVSTTHVAVGSIFGAGLLSGKADRAVFGQILLSWVLTLPIAAVLSAVSYWGLSRS
jgi:inorganic phosphate transporter, PiT family